MQLRYIPSSYHQLQAACQGRPAVGAVRPCLSEWIDRAQGEVTFRLTQVLTGHGCFGKYLRQINQELTTATIAPSCATRCSTPSRIAGRGTRSAVRSGGSWRGPLTADPGYQNGRRWGGLEGRRNLLREGGAAERDSGASLPSGGNSSGGGGAVSDDEEEEEEETEDNGGHSLYLPPWPPPTRRSQRLALARRAILPPIQGS